MLRSRRAWVFDDPGKADMSALIHLPHRTVTGDLKAAGRRAGADSGDPQLRTLAADSGPEAQVGVWECEPGGWPVVDRPDTETCYIVSGRAKITDDDTGRVVEVGPGDFVVLPPGWTGRWDVVETLRKVYTIF
jgi:uncharacterized cupin superfamily protein